VESFFYFFLNCIFVISCGHLPAASHNFWNGSFAPKLCFALFPYTLIIILCHDSEKRIWSGLMVNYARDGGGGGSNRVPLSCEPRPPQTYLHCRWRQTAR
jgi:hypothetical protein